ncbi:hypothetical protein ACYEXS_19730 [Paenibacillus sp. MAH-36]|uniref:Fibronectin type-III domain-containing protein n=1 Tax=Paenibacillus violae TaxID=3077234 RepID=A0ABU3R7D4_9BACL|nr:hypothetical protein [Paenibacillus sp. PFR10]MDU0200174.1 hypothetical protein [Paenibacillus sp. PFR10]
MALINTTTSVSPLGSGRKVTRLSNGWLVALVSEGARNHKVLKSTDNGATWSTLTTCIYPFSGNYYLSAVASIASTGTTVLIVGATRHQSNSDGAFHAFRFDATTVGSTTNAIGTLNGPPKAVDMVYDASTNTMHTIAVHATGISNNHLVLYYWSGDLGTNWTQIPLFQLTGQTIDGAAISVNASGHPVMFYQNSSTAHLTMVKATTPRPTANMPQVDFGQLGYVPQPSGPISFMSMVKNPNNGYMYLVWANPLDQEISAIRSTDGGINWSSRTSFGALNTAYQDCQATIDNQGRVVAIWSTKSSVNNKAEIFIANSAANDITSWSTPTLLDIGNITGGLVSSPAISHDPNALPNNYYFMWRRNDSGTYYDFLNASNIAPNAPVITYPPQGAWIPTRTPLVQWNFSDPDPGDYQSQYWIQLVNSAYSAVLKDTEWLSGNVRSWQMPADWITADGTYYLRMMVRDSAGANSQPGVGTPGDTTFYNVYFGVDIAPPVITSVSPQQYVKGNAARVWAYGVFDNVAVQYVSIYAVRPDLSYYLLGNMTSDGANNFYFDVTDINIDGNWHYDMRAYDPAGNVNGYLSAYVFRDTVAPNTPTQNNGTIYATSNSVSWSAFSDGSVSSGLASTVLSLQKFNGSTWQAEPGFPKSVAGLSYSFTGLTQATLYRWGVQYSDNAGNANPISYTTFTTNAYATTSIVNLTSSSSLYNKRPKIRIVPVDTNDSTLTDIQLQVSASNTFTTNIIDATRSVSSAGWSVTGPMSSGVANPYIPQKDIGVGTFYVRSRAYDGKDWGPWCTPVQFSIQAPSYPTNLGADDTAISKRTVDDIRFKVNAVRQARGLAPIVWTDSTIVSKVTNVRPIHMIELRQALIDVFNTLILTAPTWTDPIISNAIDRKGQHWIEFRQALTQL